jgi:hypothetical protein
MAFFNRYTVPPDLSETAELLKNTSHEIYRSFKTRKSNEYLDYLVEESATALRGCRERLLAENRENEIELFAKHLYKIGVMEDNRPYNAVYVTIVKRHLLQEN